MKTELYHAPYSKYYRNYIRHENHRLSMRKKREKKIRRQLAFLFVFFIILAGVLGFYLAPSVKTTAAASHKTETYYKSIEVNHEETLSSIADRYNKNGTLSDQDYMKEIQKINHLRNTDTIHEGAWLTIPYYVETEIRS